jgi:hypothetical protein
MKKAILILFLLSCCSSNERVIEIADTTSTSTTTTTIPPKNLEIEKAYYACGLDSNTYYNYLEEENLIVINGTNPTSLFADTEKVNNLCIFQYLKFPDYLVTRLTSFLYLSKVQKVELENLQVSWFYNRNSGYTIGISDILENSRKNELKTEACRYQYDFVEIRNGSFLDAYNDGYNALTTMAASGSFSEDERAIAQSNIQKFYDEKKILDNKLNSKKYSAEHPELTKLHNFLTEVVIDMIFVEVPLNSYLNGDRSNSVISLIEIGNTSLKESAEDYVAAHTEYIDSCQ